MLVTRDLDGGEQRKDVFLLVEIRKPPMIIETLHISSPFGDDTTETRLPGTPLIGHANVWLFRLSSRTSPNDCSRLFDILSRQNLTSRRFSGENIVALIGTPAAAQRYLDSIQLLSNDLWVTQNQEQIDDFLNRRWPRYPFEAKFEIMKLISNHIITAHDLVVDETAELILSQCSVNTLIACTGN